ncbi:phage portal protein [Corynebacterium sp. zg-331]|uniref:phage portal protein n=1 Tax=unclassified Corynebacterium TaxID=2624378 RepID=UPI00128C18BF|nr:MULTISPECIES: phage portal protein [unclassified Corynebacterium]MBC3186298.1 phage portal protein [Corynebacterium sp. zg-331]MPV52787.1 phage portal protein [Corynebacterium sp. zg331]
MTTTNMIHRILSAPGLDAVEARLLGQLASTWSANLSRNLLRSAYYDGEHSLRAAGRMGIAIPPVMERISTVLGWPAKAIEVLDNRLDLQGFVIRGEADQDEGVQEIVTDNHLLTESSMIHIDSMIHGVAFVTITQGDPLAGEPDVVISARSATEASALWSNRARRIVAGMTINPGIPGVEPDQVCLWMEDRVVTCWQDGNAVAIDRRPHSLGRVPMVMLPYRPRMTKRYGMSRISRPLMDATDSAARTLLRMEGTAEFFSFPQRYILNAQPEDFDQDTFTTYLNRLLVLSPAEDGGAKPEVGTFGAASPAPHIEQLKAIAMLVSGETGIPPGALGIIHDNPSSADAIRVGEAELVKIAERAQAVYGAEWVEVIRIAQHIRDGIPDERMAGLQAQWRDPATPTRAADAQSVMSLVQAGVYPARSRVTWERLGLDPVTISRLEAEALRDQGQQMLHDLMANEDEEPTPEALIAASDEEHTGVTMAP